MAVLYGIFNIAFINLYVIYYHNILSKNEKPLSPRNFLKKLSTELISPWMAKRLEVPTLKRTPRKTMAELLPNNNSDSGQIQQDEPPTKKRNIALMVHPKSAECLSYQVQKARV